MLIINTDSCVRTCTCNEISISFRNFTDFENMTIRHPRSSLLRKSGSRSTTTYSTIFEYLRCITREKNRLACVKPI